MMRRFLLIFSLLMLLVPTVHADYAVLRNGQRLHIDGYLRRGTTVLLYVSGGRLIVPADQIVRFEPEDVFTRSASRLLNVPFAKQIQAAAAKSDIDQNLISSVIAAESDFNPRVVSPKHALGLMQLMPRTAAMYAVDNPFDPGQNIMAGTHYLKKLLDQYGGNLTLALAAYNAGPSRVAQYRGVPPFPETRAYIRRVTENLSRLKAGATSLSER